VAGINWSGTNANRQVRLQATFTEGWDERDETGGELFKPTGYGVVDLYLTQRVGRGTTIRAGLLNLTDRTYWNWGDIRGLGPTDPVLPYLAQPGRNVSVSLNFNWQ
jgi:hemoglobin/transferrin/lactoferrin receptor protein